MSTKKKKPTSMLGNLRKRQTQEWAETDEDRTAKCRRENQQLIIYLFVAAVITIAWFLGVFGFSFTWTFLLIVLTFVVWWGKVITLTEHHVKEKELAVHRRRALRQSETAEWLNFVLNRWWVFSAASISDLIKKNLDPLLADVKPAFLESIELHSFSVGDRTPFIKYCQVYEPGEGAANNKKPMSWSNVVTPPKGLQQTQTYQVVIDADTGLQCEDFKMVFRTRLGGKWMGMNLDVAIEKLNISGKMQFVLHMNRDISFPHISSVTLSFVEKPEVWFAVRMLRAVQMMEIPILKSWLHHLVMDGLTQALVDPGKVDFKLESMGPTSVPQTDKNRTRAAGVLTVSVCGEQSKGNVFMEDTRYCQLKVGEQRRHTQNTQGAGAWEDTCSFLIYSLTEDKLNIKCKSKVLLSTQTLAQFEILLADFPLEHKPCVETTLEDKVAKRQGGGQVKLLLKLEYQRLPDLQSIIDGPGTPVTEKNGVAGVLYICVHSASSLLGLDRNGFSDPYCIVYSNGKKIKTTHYVCRSKNPKWEVAMEIIVGDFTKTMISFIVNDWDGHNASEDDFLGSSHILLTEDETCVVQRNLTLGYNLLNVGQVDSNKLGTIQVSVIFRPAGSVAMSEDAGVSSMLRESQQSKGKGIMASAAEMATEKQKLMALREKKSADSMGVGDLLSLGHELLELNMIRAKDLVPMDSNGFSDPYCDVKINGERKFTTSTKKKTLNPVWDEWVTMQLPNPNETLEIVVWDRDAFFQKDFLGLLTFSVDEIKKATCSPVNDGWFVLQRIHSGSIQLGFKIISDETNKEVEATSPCSMGSESTDSGVPLSAPPFTPNDLSMPSGSHDSRSRNSAPPSIDTTPAHTISPHGGPGSNSPCLNVPSIITPQQDDTGVRNGSGIHGNTLPGKAEVGHTPRSSKRRFSFRMNRASSEGIKGKNADPSSPTSVPVDNTIPKFKTERRQSLDSALMDMSKSMQPVERYYGVSGQVLNIKGLQGNTQALYCKLRLDSHTAVQRARKSSSNKVIAKSKSVDGYTEAFIGLDFIVDQGYGIVRDALLIFDVKTSGKSHLATKSYTLQQLFGEAHVVTKWIELEKGITLEVTLNHANNPIMGGKRQRGGFFQVFRSQSLHRIKES